MATTTIKVPKHLRERISEAARRKGVTAAALIERGLDELDRRERWERVSQAYATLPPDDDYWSEVRAWDATISDGLPDERP